MVAAVIIQRSPTSPPDQQHYEKPESNYACPKYAEKYPPQQRRDSNDLFSSIVFHCRLRSTTTLNTATPTPRPAGWTVAVSFCLPGARRNRRPAFRAPHFAGPQVVAAFDTHARRMLGVEPQGHATMDHPCEESAHSAWDKEGQSGQ